MIDIDQLEEMFEGIANGAKWDMTKPMLWGYFCTDPSKEKLEALVPMLERDGCRFVDIFVPELDEGQLPYYFLHVESEEIHSPASLHKRNAGFYSLVDRMGIDSYDGMDVGPIK